MFKRSMIVALLLVIAYTAHGEAHGGPIANALYSNSMYGVAHPLTNEFPLPMEYALTERDVKKKRSWDAVIGVGANLFVPGLGSLIIGDPNSLGLFLGFAGSLALTGFGGVWAIGSSMGGDATGVLTGEIIAYAGLALTIGFRVWGIVSPLQFVSTDRYLERFRRQ